MKMIHRLKTSEFLATLVVAIVGVELIAWRVTQALEVRFDSVAIGAVAWRYDGDGYE
jgi:hypothetical protein